MKSVGNAQPQTCVQNILSIIKGEVPYEREMGIEGSLFDKPVSEVKDLVLLDAQEQIEKYEPRVVINSLDVSYAENGTQFIIEPDISVME